MHVHVLVLQDDDISTNDEVTMEESVNNPRYELYVFKLKDAAGL